MSAEIVPINNPLAEILDEKLSASQWAELVGVDVRTFNRRNIAKAEMGMTGTGQFTQLYRRSDLPPDYQIKLQEKLEDYRLISARDLLGRMNMLPAVFQPAKKFTTFPAATQELALKRKEVMRVYFDALDAGRPSGDAERLAMSNWTILFGKSCSDSIIRKWAKAIRERGGMSHAPNEAFIGLKNENGKAVPHAKVRLENRIPADLIAEFKSRCTLPGMMHISGAYRSLEVDWMMGREVPGLGHRQFDNQPFPFKLAQLRQFAPGTGARLLGSMGKAVALRDAMPHVVSSTAALHRAERYLLDDTRIDIIATHDLTGRPVELKSYWIIDLATRRIEGYLIREAGNIRSTDVEALVARTLRSCGVAPTGAPYITTIKFENGTVACSPAQQSFLEGAFAGRLKVSRTKMNGGKNFKGDYAQDRSGHWMGKGHVESLMRTVAYFFQHIPGQRGGDYRRQPAALGFKGRNKESGMLDYNRGSQIHDAALLGYTNRAIEYIDNGLEERIAAVESNKVERVGERLKISSLMPVSRVTDAIKEMVAYYNARTNHRMEGFERIEWQDDELRNHHRMESPNEKAIRLEREWEPERLSAADAAQMVRVDARTVTVKPNGVTIDINSFKSLNFWKEDSIVCHEVDQLATSEKKYIAVLDPEAILQGKAPEIYLLRGNEANWKVGDPAQFIEALPLTNPPQRNDEAAMAAALEKKTHVQNRMASELLRAAGPEISRRLAAVTDNTSKLREVVTTTLRTGPVVDADFPQPEAATTREAQRANSNFAETLGSPEQIANATDDEM